MKTGNLATYVNTFFDELEVYEDIANRHSFKAFIREAVRSFLEDESQDNAYEVYRTFFDSYRIQLGEKSNSFLDIVDILRQYEETAATLIDKQRDHFVHAVNVFVTGLAVFASNAEYRKAFHSAVPEKEYAFAYSTRNEEFFYRWGIASLFHDIGYPIEIAGHQLNRFLAIVSDADGKDTAVKARISYENFSELNKIAEVKPADVFSAAYREAYKSAIFIDTGKPLELMAHRISRAFGTDIDETVDSLRCFTTKMADTGFIDHGYFSSIIILKWYGYLIQKADYRSEYFFWPVVDSATAILLHNYFRNVLQKEDFELGPMNCSDNPIAWLLILCDELQEWNRVAHGIKTRTFTLANKVYFGLKDGYLAANFVTAESYLPDTFCKEKIELLRTELNLDSVFPNGFFIDNESLSALSPIRKNISASAPRPIIDNLELLAIAIHELYNRKQLQDYPGVPLKYPQFSDLPDDLKYSNLRQAIGIYNKLTSVGLCLRKKGEPGDLSEIPAEYVEALAEKEHNDWMAERISSGWTLGEKDVENKKTPYLLPYSELSEEIKDYDRDTIRNIPELAYMIGMAVYEL